MKSKLKLNTDGTVESKPLFKAPPSLEIERINKELKELDREAIKKEIRQEVIDELQEFINNTLSQKQSSVKTKKKKD